MSEKADLEQAKIDLMHRHADQHMNNAVMTALQIIKEARSAIARLNEATDQIDDLVARYREMSR